MLCKIWGFHGGDYEECRLLIHKNPVRTSQETHYVSTTESSRLMLCKIWGFHGGGYDECRLLEYKNIVRTSQETHYASATEPSQLMLCKIWGFHGGDYEECRLLGYNNPVRTSQETHYVSVTEPSQLVLCKIWGFHGGDYEKCRLLGFKEACSYLTGDTLRPRYRVQAVNSILDLRHSMRLAMSALVAAISYSVAYVSSWSLLAYTRFEITRREYSHGVKLGDRVGHGKFPRRENIYRADISRTTATKTLAVRPETPSCWIHIVCWFIHVC
jgi:hypothetical protein